MRRTSGMPVGADVRHRLRAAQRAESEAIAAVQRAMAAEADARARLEGVTLRRQVEVSKAARSVQAAQASVVLTSGPGRAAVLLDVSPKVLKSAVKETAHDAGVHQTSVHAALSQIQRAATQCGCETRLLYGQQARAFTAAALPLARKVG